MSFILKVLVLLAAAALGIAQTQKCESTCKPKQVAAVKCATTACDCYAYDDPDYVSCLQTECGRGFDSVREIQVLTCSYLGVTLSPDPPGTAGTTTNPTSSGSGGPQSTQTQGTLSPTSGGGGGGDSGSTGSGTGSGTSSDSSAQPSKSGLSTAELIGIVIGSVSAVATIIGVWVTIKRRNGNRGHGDSAPAPTAGYKQPRGQIYQPVNNASTFQPAPVYYGSGLPPGYQPPPAYYSV